MAVTKEQIGAGKRDVAQTKQDFIRARDKFRLVNKDSKELKIRFDIAKKGWQDKEKEAQANPENKSLKLAAGVLKQRFKNIRDEYRVALKKRAELKRTMDGLEDQLRAKQKKLEELIQAFNEQQGDVGDGVKDGDDRTDTGQEKKPDPTKNPANRLKPTPKSRVAAKLISKLLPMLDQMDEDLWGQFDATGETQGRSQMAKEIPLNIWQSFSPSEQAELFKEMSVIRVDTGKKDNRGAPLIGFYITDMYFKSTLGTAGASTIRGLYEESKAGGYLPDRVTYEQYFDFYQDTRVYGYLTGLARNLDYETWEIWNNGEAWDAAGGPKTKRGSEEYFKLLIERSSDAPARRGTPEKIARKAKALPKTQKSSRDKVNGTSQSRTKTRRQPVGSRRRPVGSRRQPVGSGQTAQSRTKTRRQPVGSRRQPRRRRKRDEEMGMGAVRINATDFLFAEFDQTDSSPKPVDVLRTGTFTDRFGQSVEITPETLSDFVKNFQDGAAGQDVPIDKNHQRDEAYGWVKELSLADEGNRLKAIVEWNEAGRKAIQDKIYRYVSATVDMTNRVLKTISLVNLPAVKGLAPIELSEGFHALEEDEGFIERIINKVVDWFGWDEAGDEWEEGYEEEYEIPLIPFVELTVPPNPSTKHVEGMWSKPTLSDFTSKSWDELTDAEKRRIALHFAFVPSMPPQSFSELKLPHHRPDDGAAVDNGVRNALAGLLQAEGILASDRDRIRGHLEAHLAQFKELMEAEVEITLAGGANMDVYELTEDQVEEIREEERALVKAEFAERDKAREEAKAEFVAELKAKEALKEQVNELYAGDIQLSMPKNDFIDLAQNPTQEGILQLAKAMLVDFGELGSSGPGRIESEGQTGEDGAKHKVPEDIDTDLKSGEMTVAMLREPQAVGLLDHEFEAYDWSPYEEKANGNQ